MKLFDDAKFEFLKAQEREAVREVFTTYQVWFHSLGLDYSTSQMRQLKQLLADTIAIHIPGADEIKIDETLGIVQFKAFGKLCVFANGGFVSL